MTAPVRLPLDTTITRRSLLLGGLTFGVVGLTGCGSDERPGSAGNSDDDAFPVSVEHKYGSTTIEAAPQRIVTLGLTEQDYVLALGGTLVAATEWFGEYPGALWPWAADALGDEPVPETLSNVDGVNIERVASLRPDLILCTNGVLTEQEYDRLTEIAPTVAASADFPDYGTPWPDQTRAIGTALGVANEAERLIAEVEAGFEQARADHPEFDGASAVIAADLGDGSYYVYAEGPAPGFLTALGFQLPAAVVDLFGADRVPMPISAEQLGLLADADLVVWGVYGADRSSLEDSSVYQGLPVSREGRSLYLPEQSLANGVVTFGSVLSLPQALDELVPRLAAVVDGDPTTQPDPVT